MSCTQRIVSSAFLCSASSFRDFIKAPQGGEPFPHHTVSADTTGLAFGSLLSQREYRRRKAGLFTYSFGFVNKRSKSRSVCSIVRSDDDFGLRTSSKRSFSGVATNPDINRY